MKVMVISFILLAEFHRNITVIISRPYYVVLSCKECFGFKDIVRLHSWTQLYRLEMTGWLTFPAFTLNWLST